MDKTMTERLKRLNRAPNQEYGRIVQFLSIKSKHPDVLSKYDMDFYEDIIECIGLLFTELYPDMWEEKDEN